MSAARKAAEEALARWDTYADRPHSDARHEALYACVRSLRALLAEREATPGPSCSTCDGYGSTTVPVHDRNGYPIPEQRKCDDCDGTGHVPLAPPPAPCGGRCEDALDSRSPCPSCAERLAPPPALSFGSTSTACSDSTPAQPLPTCVNCGSNFFTPAPSPARDEVRDALREVADSGVEFDDERLDYVTVQIDRETWNAVRAIAARGGE